MSGQVNVTVVKGLEKQSHDPCVWRLFGLMRHRNISLEALANKSGVARKTLVSWLYKRRSPNLRNFRAAANAIGYEIVLVPLGSVERYHGPIEINFTKKD